MENIDFLSIGDTTTDAFIRLKDASVNCDIDRENCKLSVRFADKVPYEFVEVVKAVGNSANAAVASARLGLKTSFVTNIGDDENGRDCLEELKRNNINTEYISVEVGRVTNYHYVLWYDADRTILVKQNEFNYALPQIRKPKWIYLSSLGAGTEKYHEAICQYVRENPEVNLAFQPGTFQIKLGVEKLKDIYENTNVFFCNTEEARKILKMDGDEKEHDFKKLAHDMSLHGPQIVVITDGLKGAYIYDRQKNEFFFMPPYPDPKPPYERTGAGDAFESTFTAVLALGKTLEEAMLWAPINSMSVVQFVGAQKGLLDQKSILDWLSKA